MTALGLGSACPLSSTLKLQCSTEIRILNCGGGYEPVVSCIFY